MNEQMEFPETWEEYEQEYGFNDSDEVYTNNSRLIQSFRVKQWLDHLEQEPCEDAISRQAVLAAMRKNHRSGGRDIDGDYIEGDYRECLYDDIVSLIPVTPQPNHEDIAKAFQIGLGLGFGEKHDEMDKVIDEIKKVITPQQKIGHWIERESGTEDKEMGFETVIVCSYCDFPATTFYSEDCESRTQIRTHFCPNCGAKMQESEG